MSLRHLRNGGSADRRRAESGGDWSGTGATSGLLAAGFRDSLADVDYVYRFVTVLLVSLLVGCLLGHGVIFLFGEGLFPGRDPGELRLIAFRGGLIFGGIWGVGLAIVSCFMLGHRKGQERERA